MEDKRLIDYIFQVFTTYGVIVVIFLILGKVMGDGAQDLSTLYELGSQGFTIATLAELFLVAIVIVASQAIFLTDKVIKRVSLLIRLIMFFGVVIVCMVAFIIMFDWFPLDNLRAWVSFILSFGICSVIGTIVACIRERDENSKMEQALDRLQRK